MSTTTRIEEREQQSAARPPDRSRTWRVIAVTLGAALALVIAGIGAGWLLWGQTAGEEPVVSTTVSGGPGSSPGQLGEPVVAVASSLLPTVVQIQSTAGLGSGVIYDTDGLILTAAHVVSTDQQVAIRLADGDQLTGDVVGADSNSDIAVIKIDQAGLTAAPLAVDVELEVGQTAVALGSPYGLAQTVTVGVVSATERALVGSDGIVRAAVQTDAPINPGNSGGVLADLDGQVIGINDAIFSKSGGNEGVGFAVPITVAKNVADMLVAGEPIEIAYLGVSGTDPSVGEAGVLITSVAAGSPGDDAGLIVGDLITAVDDNRVESMVDLTAEVGSHQPGDRVVIHVIRDGSEMDIDVTLGSGG